MCDCVSLISTQNEHIKFSLGRMTPLRRLLVWQTKLHSCCSWAWPDRGYLQTQRAERSGESGCTDTSLTVLQSQDAETQHSQMRTVTIVGLVLYHNDECLKWRKVLRARMQITKHSKKHSKSGSLDTCLWIPRSQNTETLQHCKENQQTNASKKRSGPMMVRDVWCISLVGSLEGEAHAPYLSTVCK